MTIDYFVEGVWFGDFSSEGRDALVEMIEVLKIVEVQRLEAAEGFFVVFRTDGTKYSAAVIGKQFT